MSDLSLVTWNVNSIRAREERLLAFLDRHAPDILCLQETKCVEDQFPFDEVRSAGYEALVVGQPTYNGVAILSKSEATPIARELPGDDLDDQARFLAAEIAGIEVVNIYVPNGKSVNDEKYDYKLGWLARLAQFLADRLDDERPLVVCGDYNIAPADEDAAFPEQWASSVLCHSDVRDLWNRLIGLGLHDLVRAHNEPPGPFTWWDYRRLAFPKGDGLRIDHLLGSRAALERSTGATVDRDERKGEKPSDHAPVIVTFSV